MVQSEGVSPKNDFGAYLWSRERFLEEIRRDSKRHGYNTPICTSVLWKSGGRHLMTLARTGYALSLSCIDDHIEYSVHITYNRCGDYANLSRLQPRRSYVLIFIMTTTTMSITFSNIIVAFAAAAATKLDCSYASILHCYIYTRIYVTITS